MLVTLEAQLIPFFEHLYQTVGYLGIVVAMALESACIPIPSEVILPLAGWMVSRNVFTLWGATIAGTIGCVVGSVVAYWVGALGGRPLVERYGRYILLSSHDMAVADRWFARYGSGAIFFSRMLPVIRTFISLPAGVAGMPFGQFVIYTALGSLPWSFALVYAGKSLGDNWESIRTVLGKFDYAGAAIAVILVVLYIYRHVSHALASPKKSPEA